jgi:hypothetical protein
MRKNLIALSAASLLALAALLAVKPGTPGPTSETSTFNSTFNIIDLTYRAGDLPGESYPAH